MQDIVANQPIAFEPGSRIAARDIKSAERPHRFEALDSLRGICALLVALMHLQANNHLYYNEFVRHSFAFVDFFFVLSGWVISYTYDFRIKSLDDLRVFVLRRLGRVYPLHLFMLVLLIAAQFCMLIGERAMGLKSPRPPFTNVWDPMAIPTHLLLLQSFGNDRTGTWNMPSWSISAEFWTYLVFALLAVAIPPRLRSIPYVIVAATGLAVIHFLSPTQMDATFDYGLFRCFAGFFLGALAQRWWKDHRLVLGRTAWTIVELAAIACIVASITAFGRSPWGITMPVIFSLTVYVFAHEGGWIATALRTRVATRLGLWSYSIYMIQGIFVFILFRNMPRVLAAKLGVPLTTIIDYEGESRELLNVGGRWGCDLLTIVYIALLVGTASLTFRLVEVPAREWIYARIRRKTPA